MLTDALPQYTRQLASKPSTMKAAQIALVVMDEDWCELVCEGLGLSSNKEFFQIRRPSLAFAEANPGDWFCVLDTGEEHVLTDAAFQSLTTPAAAAALWEEIIKRMQADNARRAQDAAIYGSSYSKTHYDDTADAFSYMYSASYGEPVETYTDPETGEVYYTMFVHPKDVL